MADITSSPTTLSHVNVPPAQTWNYLKVNEVALDVPTFASSGKVFARLPQLFQHVECGVGQDTVDWFQTAPADARYVEVPRGQELAEPIVISADAGDVLDTGVLVREGASATVIVITRDAASTDAGEKDEKNFSAALTRIVVERDAHVTLIEVVAAGDAREHLEGVGILAAEHADVEVRQYALGGATTAFGIACDLAGDASRLTLDMRYRAAESELLDVNHLCRQRGRATKSTITTSGILGGSAQKTMRETIDLIHGAKGSSGTESETVLVTGDDIVNKTLPTILCDEEDVAGNHGATIGSVSPEQLGYLADRGLSEEEATRLFERALFDDALIHAQTDGAREAILARAAQVLGDEMANDVAQTLGLGGDVA